MSKPVWLAIIVALIFVFAIGCATTREPQTCVMPPDVSWITDEDIEKANAEYARVRRALDACTRGRGA